MQLVHQPADFIAGLAINPVTGDIAHSEGMASVNLYELTLTDFEKQTIDNRLQLSSSAHLDVLPTISNDGLQTAFVSYQRRGLDGFRYIETWLKYKQKSRDSTGKFTRQ